MDGISIITTSDGSHSLFHSKLNETYHSVHGALQESQHVFIQQGLGFWTSQNSMQEIRVLEIGFGTGLNALLTLLYATRLPLKIYYESWEAHPLPPDLVRQLNYGDLAGSNDFFSKIHATPWNQTVAISSNFSLHKIQGDILKDTLNAPFNLIFYDAFGPAKQAEMWTMEILKKVTDALAPRGVWVTYCAKGQVKRDLRVLKLNVETLQGPPGKKEMIRASRGGLEIQDPCGSNTGI